MTPERKPGEQGGAPPRSVIVDLRRAHPTWNQLAEHQRLLCEGLANLGAVWGRVHARDELEIAVAVTHLCRQVDTMLGEYLVAVWWALLAMGDVARGQGEPSADGELSPAAHPAFRTAMSAARTLAAAGPTARWDGGDPSVRHRLDELRAALHRLALGYEIPDPLTAAPGAPPPVCWPPRDY